MREIYLDNAATTKPWPEVVEAVSRAMGEEFGNASSRHRRGLSASRAVVLAETAILELVGNGPWKVVFTSGGTEANTLAILGSSPRGKQDTAVSSTVEHAAVEAACQEAARRGGSYRSVSAGLSGVVDPGDFERVVDRNTAVVSQTYVAGELGTIQPVGDVARHVKQLCPRCRMHVDAVQALPQLARLILPTAVDMVSISAHKIHGPQGIGALMLRPEIQPRPLIFGGDQQEGLRPGTLNLPGIVGFGVAARILKERRQGGIEAMRRRCDDLVHGIRASAAGIRQLGDPGARAPGMAVLAVEGVASEVLLHALEMRGLFASSSSACHSTRRTPPKSLTEAGLKSNEGAVRLSLTLDTTDDEVDAAVGIVKEAVESVRGGRASRA